ncbi:uncharacterized protein LOC128289406 [Gossypium arboreum]|uniref:uncharacterized protein LOC128289406 n=1 Tax=Gossypium arboreum TaxID=29729 RepID=UPI0022F16ECC|nr:uncharacterized protein LOC128289406 [Gossypium arboreum]
MEIMFCCYKCPKEEKVPLAILAFSDYALSWWTQLVLNHQRNRERDVDSWEQLTQIMRKHFIPPHYYRDIKRRLQRLVQGNRSVDEYFKEMEMLMHRANIQEDEETTMVRFVDGLNVSIANVLDLQTYIDLEDTCKGRGHYSRDCTNTRLLLIKEDGDYTSDSDKTDPDMPKLIDDVNDCGKFYGEEELVEPLTHPRCLVVRRTLNIQLKDDHNLQQSNIFHSRCLIKGTLCSFIIDSGSCANVVSSYLVDSLALPCSKHPTPYHLQWLNEGSEVRVVKQCLITFKLGTYIDDVWCDVVPMYAAHLLLGRPWQYDRDVIHHGKLNRYSFIFSGKKYTFTPLNPKDIHNDQIDMMKFCKEVMGSKTQNSKKAERKEVSSEKSQINNDPMEYEDILKKHLKDCHL